MPDDRKTQSRPREAGGRLASKLLMPIVATTVSAAAGYAARKAPELFEKKLLPKLRELKDASGSPREGAGDLAGGLADRARAVASSVGVGSDAGGGSTNGRASLSPEQRARRRDERAAGREARRRSTKS